MDRLSPETVKLPVPSVHVTVFSRTPHSTVVSWLTSTDSMEPFGSSTIGPVRVVPRCLIARNHTGRSPPGDVARYRAVLGGEACSRHGTAALGRVETTVLFFQITEIGGVRGFRGCSFRHGLLCLGL